MHHFEEVELYFCTKFDHALGSGSPYGMHENEGGMQIIDVMGSGEARGEEEADEICHLNEIITRLEINLKFLGWRGLRTRQLYKRTTEMQLAVDRSHATIGILYFYERFLRNIFHFSEVSLLLVIKDASY